MSKTSILFQLLTQKTLEEDSIENSISASTITVSVCKIFVLFPDCLYFRKYSEKNAVANLLLN